MGNTGTGTQTKSKVGPIISMIISIFLFIGVLFMLIFTKIHMNYITILLLLVFYLMGYGVLNV